MASYPVEIRRCRHIRTNGTQCGSPAVKDKELCYFHERNRPRAADLYIDGERFSDGNIVIPVFEDAHSIQTVIQQVVQLMLSRRIDRKDAGILLYALQIASGNLKAMQAEKATPTQMVVEPEKAAETPLGMTPWSATGQGHDPEEGEKDGGKEEIEERKPPAAPVMTAEDNAFNAPMNREERTAMRKQFEVKGWIRTGDFAEHIFNGSPGPLLRSICRAFEERDPNQRVDSAKA